MGGDPMVYTVGHSTHAIETFIALLKGAGITAVADVRSVPYTRHSPQFSRAALTRSLKANGIAYSFLGDLLGARPDDRSCYRDGVAAYDLIAATDAFRKGLDRVIDGTRRYRVALMCAEKEPLDCHRTILVARALGRNGVTIRHILADGSIEEHSATERRLLRITNQETIDFFEDPLEKAYRLRGEEIAFSEDAQEKVRTEGDRMAAV